MLTEHSKSPPVLAEAARSGAESRRESTPRALPWSEKRGSHSFRASEQAPDSGLSARRAAALGLAVGPRGDPV